MNHVEADVLKLVARLYPSEFALMDEFCAVHQSFIDPGVRRFDFDTPKVTKRRWTERFGHGPRVSYSFQVADRDEAGFRMLSGLTGRGVNLVANALSQSTDHVLSFFSLLCAELSFYVGCLNLHDRLIAKGEPICAPVPLDNRRNSLSY